MDAPDPSEIPLPGAWAENLAAVVAAPLACLPARALPHPARRVVEGMRGSGLLAGWDRKREGLGLYVTLSPWAAECLRAALGRIPHRGPGRREILDRLRELDLSLREEEPVQWGRERAGRPPEAPAGDVAALGRAGYRPPTIAVEARGGLSGGGSTPPGLDRTFRAMMLDAERQERQREASRRARRRRRA